jgi:uncharacterized surface protein with fasciclin (FAS1) repeats
MKFTTPLLQKLTLTSLLTLGALAVPTLARSVETPVAPAQTPMPTPMPTPISIPNPMPMPKSPIEPIGEPVESEPMKPKKAASNTIVDVATENGSFKTLTAALKAADLVEILQGDGPFTVFAPTDAAFAKLPKGTVEMLLKPENKAELVRILTYHVVSGKVLSSSLKSGKVETVEGSPINVVVGKKDVMLNKSKVTGVDVAASNGVIHVIDTVLLPPTKPTASKPSSKSTAPTAMPAEMPTATPKTTPKKPTTK